MEIEELEKTDFEIIVHAGKDDIQLKTNGKNLRIKLYLRNRKRRTNPRQSR
jgi:hypothetical protein